MQKVNHSTGEYVRGDASTNAAEGFFAQLKRSIDGTHHHVSKVHLPGYLTEFDFRYSTRKMSDTHRMHFLMGHVGGRRLTYKRVTLPDYCSLFIRVCYPFPEVVQKSTIPHNSNASDGALSDNSIFNDDYTKQWTGWLDLI